MRKIVLTAAAFLAFGCSHVSQMASAEKHESAALKKADNAVKKVDQAKSAVLGRVATYNREMAYAMSLPPSPNVTAAESHILTLQYALTGPADESSTKLDSFVDIISKDDQQAHEALTQAALDDAKLRTAVQTANEERDKAIQARDIAITKVNAMALVNAGQADKLNHLWDVVYAFIAIGLLVLLLRALYAFGVFGATVAAKAP